MAHINPNLGLIILWDKPQRYGLSTMGDSVIQENKEQLCELCFMWPYLDCKTEASEAELFVPVGSSALILTIKLRRCSFTFEK